MASEYSNITQKPISINLMNAQPCIVQRSFNFNAVTTRLTLAYDDKLYLISQIGDAAAQTANISVKKLRKLIGILRSARNCLTWKPVGQH